MSTIGPAADLSAYLRLQLKAVQAVVPAAAAQTEAAAQLGASKRASKAVAQPPEAAVRGPEPTQQPVEDLASAVARRVAAIAEADPDRRRKAFRVLLESVLLQEWGHRHINDPALYQLVDAVNRQMEANAELSSLMNEAADLLLGPPTG